VTRSLRWDMDGLAIETWGRIARGDARGIRLREDTITETNLLDLDMWHPNLRVHRFNQTAENVVGGDWDWFLGSGNSWFRLRIQAKRMDDLEYRQLQHEGALGDSYQYDTLIRVSEAERIPTFPYYVFFNGWRGWPAGVQWHGCPGGRTLANCIHASMREFGCSAIPARLVRAIHAGRGVAGRQVTEYLPWSVPWSWLFGPDPVRSVANPRSPKRVVTVPPSTGARDWGDRHGAPRNPTVHEALRWHRSIDAVTRRLEGGLSDLSVTGDLWGLVRAEYGRQGRDGPAKDRDDLEMLGPLPPYVAVLLQDRGSASEVDLQAEFASQLGAAPRTVILTELELDNGVDGTGFGALPS